MPQDRGALTVNAGSSSLRLGLHDEESGALLASERREGARERPALDAAIAAFLHKHAAGPVVVVAHRIVHGRDLGKPALVDAAVEAEIERACELAPLHNPVALAGIRACRDLLGRGVPQVAVFDTAFFRDLPEVARSYALPRALVAKHGIRRYGFHGLAHEAMWRAWARDHGGKGRVVTLQLGAGCSAAAIRDGAPRDTSMGFSPLEGLVMATRPGDVDAGVLLHLMRAERWTPDEASRVLDESSGLLGVSGLSPDTRLLLEHERKDPSAHLAIELYAHRARKYVGAYMAVLGGLDGVVLGGGVGEHSPDIRERILSGLEPLGIALDPEANRAATGTAARLSGPGSRVEVHVVPVDEAAILVEEAKRVVA